MVLSHGEPSALFQNSIWELQGQETLNQKKESDLRVYQKWSDKQDLGDRSAVWDNKEGVATEIKFILR